MSSLRTVRQVIPAQDTSDGDGVKIKRIAGQRYHALLDPFLMLDEIRSDDRKDYIGGFPPHPHRGFETITYLLDGRLRHQDHLGNEGLVSSGGAQWMTAGKGIIHSEMPEQENGLLHGFQLWLNLPAQDKLCQPQWRDVQHNEMHHVHLDEDCRLTGIAGDLSLRYKDTQLQVSGPIQTRTNAIIADIELGANKLLELHTEATHCVIAFVIYGALINKNSQPQILSAQHMGVYSQGDITQLHAVNESTRVLLLSGPPLQEPIVQYGPFVMNTEDEIHTAIQDYQHQRFV